MEEFKKEDFKKRLANVKELEKKRKQSLIKQRTKKD
jgi:hypothetical protein